MNFESLRLSSKVLAAVAASGYSEPTPIQAGAIPHVLDRRDVLGLAQTGTGKTASFVLPMLSLLEKGRARARMPRTLILEPTRELAAQVADHFNRYGINHKLTVALLIGGVSFEEQHRKIDRGADVVIATPGRLLDHFERGKLLLQGVEIFVIDEADRMLDMGFIPDIERICKILPFTRQTLFFSATMPAEIQKLVDNFLQNPVRVEVAPPTSAAETVTQYLVSSPTEPKAKRATLRQLIRSADGLTNAIIFCNRKRDVGILARSLQRHGFSAGALHGDMDQRARMATLEAFRKDELTLLVASDVAARGLDIPAVSHIFNHDVPHHSEDYIHRIGRTGRAGRAGTAFTIVTPADRKALDAIEKMLGKSIAWASEPATEDLSKEAPRRGRSRTRGGERRGRKPRERDEAHVEAERETAVQERSEATEEAHRDATAEAKRGAPVETKRTSAHTEPRPEAAKAGGRTRRERPPRGDRQRDRERSREPRERDVAFGETPYVPAFLLRSIGQRAARVDSDNLPDDEEDGDSGPSNARELEYAV